MRLRHYSAAAQPGCDDLGHQRVLYIADGKAHPSNSEQALRKDRRPPDTALLSRTTGQVARMHHRAAPALARSEGAPIRPRRP